MKKLIIKGMDKRYFSKKIVEWYLQNKRELPWRDTKDPYKIWLSEIILQQTRVSQGLPYYEKFVSAYPTVNHLAKAPEQHVLRHWQGLGYYTRARNLHKCAKHVARKLGASFPQSFAELKQLPGVGDYTAAAIASFAFKENVAVVDGNVFRVLARIFGIQTPINTPAAKKEFTSLANDLIDPVNPDLHNQAIMEFGATFCTPKNPQCEFCPVKKSCHAFQHDLQTLLPVKEQKSKIKTRHFFYIVWRNGNKMALKERTEKDIWLGLYDFPLLEESKNISEKVLIKKIEEEFKIKVEKEYSITSLYKHVLTHQHIYCRFIILDLAKIKGTMQNLTFYSPSKIASLPKPVLITRFLEDYTFLS